MDILVILVLGFVALVKSDIGYQYKVPTSYDVPFGSVGALNDRKYYHVEKQAFSGSLVTPSSLLQTPVHEHSAFHGLSNAQNNVEFTGTPQRTTDLLNNLPVSPNRVSTFNLLANRHAGSGNVALDSRGNSLAGNVAVQHTQGTGSLGNVGVEYTHGTGSIGNVGVEYTPGTGSTGNVAIDSNTHYAGSTKNVLDSNTQNTGSAGNVAIDSRLNTHNFGTANVAVDSNFAAHQNQEVEVQKHLYFYSAPEEPEEIRTRIITPPTPAKKNVKILFIKTPTFNTAPITIPALPQNEDKTLVYVLVKKPEETSIVLPTPAPSNPVKPEVFFIKYKTQKEAEDAVSNIQDSGSGGISSVNTDSNIGSVDTRINYASKTGSGGSVTDIPTIISTQQPTGYGGSVQYSGLGGSSFGVNVNGAQGGIVNGAQGVLSNSVHGGFSDINTRFNVHGGVTTATPDISILGGGQSQFSSDAITNFEGSAGAKQFEHAGSFANLPTASSTVSGVKVHQVYGPPKNSR